MKIGLSIFLLSFPYVASAAAGVGCNGSRFRDRCSNYPGIEVGQYYQLHKSVSSTKRPTNFWAYFVDGRQVQFDDLVHLEGQEYCAINAVVDGWHTRDQRIEVGSYYLDQLNWVGNQLHLYAVQESKAEGFTLACGRITNQEIDETNPTSAAAIQQHLKGILELLRTEPIAKQLED